MFEAYEGKRYLIAVSGGPDSMALLHMCIQEGVQVVVAHVNYHQRAQADEEERNVQAYCKKYEIPCFVKDEPFIYEGNFEAAARDYRYAFFVEIIEKLSLDGLMTAHHEDDLLETYLMQKEKGIVPAWYGLAKEAHYHQIPLIRPLLSYRKQDLVDYCHQFQITYYIDETNLQDIHTRNQIRNHVLPELTDEQRHALLQEINQKNTALSKLRSEAQSYIQDQKVKIETYRILRKEVRCCLIRLLLPPVSISEKFVMEMDEVIMKHSDFVISVKEYMLVQDDGYFFVIPKIKEYSYTFPSLKEEVYPYFQVQSTGKGVEALTLSESDYPITIRNFQDGDSIEMRFGTKRVSRFFIDRHIPRYQRLCWPVVVNAQGNVILVPGLGCDVQHYSTNPDVYVVPNVNKS